MTIYLINSTHTYNDKTNELKNIKTGKMIKIAAMRIKCLEYMLNHAQQEIIYKKQLTNELWGERSQFISDANLTQILYLLRRDLKGFGLSQFFSTVPRTGIKAHHVLHRCFALLLRRSTASALDNVAPGYRHRVPLTRLPPSLWHKAHYASRDISPRPG